MMGALTFFFKLVPYIWPFLREMVLGRKSFLETIRDNKKKAFFVVLVMCSFALNFVLIPRSSTLAVDYIALDRKYKELEAKYKQAQSSPKQTVAQGTEVRQRVKEPEVAVEPEIPVISVPHSHSLTTKPKVKKLVAKPRVNPLDQVKLHYEQIRLREEREARESSN